MARDENLIARAKTMRREATTAEARLWRLLRAGRTIEVKVSRQAVIGPFIVDFAARSHRLVIELDGDSHDQQADYDARRTSYLEAQGYRVIRFCNEDVLANPEGVLFVIREALMTPPLPGAARLSLSPHSGERVGNAP